MARVEGNGANSKMVLGCAYRSSSSSAENDSKLYNNPTLVVRRTKIEALIMGDFNQPDIDWTTERHIYTTM